MKNKYFLLGSRSEKEGISTAVFVYDENDNLVSGVPNPERTLYKAKEISESEYLSIKEEARNPNTKFGFAGIVNDTGWEKYQKWLKERDEAELRQNESQIALCVKKIKKLLQLEIIEQDDVDTEIEQQGMTMFKNEIKKRLNQ